MRLRVLGLAVALSASLVETGDGAVRSGTERPVVVAGRAPRDHRDVRWRQPSELATLGLAGWTAIWDRDTDVPLRMWGSTAAIPGVMTDASIAEAAARQFLAAHLAVLAPGARLADFVLVANQLGGSGDVRSVGFEQRLDGVRVLDGAIGFAFKRDRLIMVSSTALPGVHVTQPAHRLAPTAVTRTAIAWLAAAGHTVTPRGRVASERVIVPLVHPRRDRSDISYQLAEQLSVEAPREPGRWDVWIDANDGRAIARHATLEFASGTVLFDVPDQDPIGPRHPQPAPDDTQTVDGQPVTSTLDGTVTWTGSAPASVQPAVIGPLVAVTNTQGAAATGTLVLPVDGSVTWSLANDEYSDAQLSAFIAASRAKHFAKTLLDPGLGYLDHQIPVFVNELSTCNAYSTGDDIHFYIADAQCENTARLQDVVYHEFGHSLHNNALIPGVGVFEPSLSEGLADTLAGSITGESGMGRGFYHDNNFLRDFDPAVKKIWPQDATGEPHADGEILDEAMWELRQALLATLGTDAGTTQILKIYYGIVQRAADIPSAYAEALVADDDDGDLTNGTPHICAINQAFMAHGLADPIVALGITLPVRTGYTIALPAPRACPGNAVTAELAWRVRGGVDAQLPLVASAGTISAVIPTQPDGTVVEYKVTVMPGIGRPLSLPDNPADPYYEFYVGPVTTLWCTDFESGPGGWTHGEGSGEFDEWEVGPPHGQGGDPAVAHGGTSVLGLDLSFGGLYPDATMSFADSPDVDLMGHHAVRLQYYRWLGVEDGFYDQATISANGTTVWSNFASPVDPDRTAEINHVDKEWRFQDVDLGAQASTGTIKLRFDLMSDIDVSLAGWNIDDICLVATDALATCGNGTVDPGEACDDGNTTDGDGCSATCQLEGADPHAGGGCCSASGNPLGSLVLGMVVVGLTLGRRRAIA